MASQKTKTDTAGQDCYNKIICTPKTHISFTKPAKGNYQTYRKLMYDFIWDCRPDEIKRETLTSDYDKKEQRKIYMIIKNKLGKTSITK